MDEKPPKDEETSLILAGTAMNKAVKATLIGDPVEAGKWLDVVTKAYKAYGEMVHIAALIHITNNPRR